MAPQNLNQKDFRRLLQIRGGCRCWSGAPCLPCISPVSKEEEHEISIMARNELRSCHPNVGMQKHF